MTITFSRSNEKPYGVFSPLYPCVVRLDDFDAPSAEHAFQYAKAKRPEVRDWMMAAPSPSLLATLSAAIPSYEIVKGWSRGVHQRMHRVMSAKFDQHPELAEILVGTRDEPLTYEPAADSAPNRYWGHIRGEGENALGRILADVRADLIGSQ